MYKLIPLADFVLEQCKNIPEQGQVKALFNIFNYTNFVKKEIDIEMFYKQPLFKGFEIDKKQKAFINNEKSIRINYYGTGTFILRGKYIETIEDLTKHDLELTDYAVSEIFK